MRAGLSRNPPEWAKRLGRGTLAPVQRELQTRSNGLQPTDRTLTDTAYELLKERLIKCDLAPGAHITESQLVDQFGIGKTPVREAIVRLVQGGLIRSMPRHGYEVAPITLQYARDLFGLRRIVEPAGAVLAVGRLDIAALREINARCEALYGSGDQAGRTAFLEANQEFHLTLCKGAGNRRLLDLMQRVMDDSQRLFHFGLRHFDYKKGIGTHEPIIAALERHEGETAAQLLREEIDRSDALVADSLMSSPSLLDLPLTSPIHR